MTDALTLLSDHADETGMSIIDMFGSKEAGLFAAGLVKDLEKTGANLDAVNASAGATDKAFGTMNEGLAATMDRLKAKFSVLLIDLGESLAPTIETIGTGIAGLLEIFMAMPAPLRTGIVLFGTLAAGVLAFAGPLLKVIQLGKALSGVMTLLAANPWVLAIVALAVGAMLVIKHWDKVKAFLGDLWGWIEDTAGAVGEFFVDLWEDVSGAVVDAWNGIVDGVTSALDAVTGAVSTAWDAITGATVAAWDAITGAISSAWDAITDAVTTAVDAVAGAIEAGFEAISFVVTTYVELYRTVIETGWNVIRTVVETAVGAISAVVSTGFEIVRGVVDSVSNAIRSVIEFHWNAAKAAVGAAIDGIQWWVAGFLNIPNLITSAFSGLANAIAGPFQAAFSAIQSAWNSTVGGFSVSIPGVLGFGGASFTIPSMATGGVISDPMLALVGDAGAGNREIVTPENLMRQVVSDALADAGGPGLHVETHLHAEAGVDVATLERMLERASTELVRVVVREVDRNRLGAGQARGALVG